MDDRDALADSVNAALKRMHDNCCRVERTAYGGLGVFATRDVRAGEVVLSERPLLLTVSDSSVSSVCAT